MPRCCIGLCVKDSEDGLVKVLSNVDKLRVCFSDIRIVVAYDKSADASLRILVDYKARHDDMVVIDVGNEHDYESAVARHVDRSQRIANARNRIVGHIYKFYSTWEYFVMMDTNRYSCVSPIDTDVLVRCMKSKEWDALSFNRDPYYDIWALSIPPLVLSCWHFPRHEQSIDAYRLLLRNRLGKLGPDEFLPVMSAFGGFAIYRTEKFVGCAYSGKFSIDMFPAGSVRRHCQILGSGVLPRPNDCEHRSFHVDAIKRNGASVMISPLFLFPHAKDYS